MRILVAYLATPGGADAVALGARLARSLEADPEITMVLPPETVIDPPGNYEELLTERAQEWLTEAKELVDDDITVSTHILFHESSAEGIIAEAERTDSAMIVVGGGGGGARRIAHLGSVVNDLMHSSPVLVAIAPRARGRPVSAGSGRSPAPSGSAGKRPRCCRRPLTASPAAVWGCGWYRWWRSNRSAGPPRPTQRSSNGPANMPPVRREGESAVARGHLGYRRGYLGPAHRGRRQQTRLA